MVKPLDLKPILTEKLLWLDAPKKFNVHCIIVSLQATLSGAMVGPMDGIGLLNASRVMATCRSDGYVLKPDKPVTTTDACFAMGNPTCFIYHTYSDVSG